MMIRKSTVVALSILVAVATAHPYAEWNNARYRWNDLFAARDEEIGARGRSQTTVEPSSCATVTYKETRNKKSHRVRVCSADPEDSPNKVCLDTRVNPCCPIPGRSRDTLVSSANASVAGEDVTVEYYRTQDPPVDVCFRLDDAHLRTKTCSQSRREGGSCLPECIVTSPNITCFNNTLTGDSSSCDLNGCQCLENYLPPDCCNKLCRENCEKGPINENGQPIGCSTCFTGYEPPTCCESTMSCNKQQKLFFYIDATASNTFENFCPLMIVMQILVAAFNSSSTSGTQITSLLFSDDAKSKTPSYVFDMNTSCSDAVQNLGSLMIDFGVCLDNNRYYNSTLFPSSCGEGTSAVKGLKEIHQLASTSTRSSAEGAIVMLTDGVMKDNASERSKVLSDLKSARISTLIVARISGNTRKADEADLSHYTSSDNILVGDEPVQLGIDIVNKMQERGIVCQDHADNITRILNETRGGILTDAFCGCHRKGQFTKKKCQHKYPTCGGSLSFGLPNFKLPSGKASQALEYMNQLLIEEEILAAVEKVFEQHHG